MKYLQIVPDRLQKHTAYEYKDYSKLSINFNIPYQQMN